MGRVYRSYDTATDRIVALKVLPPHLAEDEKYQRRFRAEARAAAGLSEPHVVPIHRFGEIDGRLFVDMRLIEGRDLQAILEQGPLDPAAAVNVIGQIAAALDAAHRVGLIHRDVKPSNILLTDDDFAYLIDFGIAHGTGETRVTSTGMAVGTLAYMAPERFSTGEADTRSDVYSLACVLHECLTGAQPYPGDSFEQQIAGHLVAPPPRPSLSRPGVPPALDDVVAVGMSKDVGARYASPIEWADAARAALRTPLAPPIAHGGVQGETFIAAPGGPVSPSASTQYRFAPSHPPGPPDVIQQQAPSPEPWWRRHAIALTAACAVVVTAIAVPSIIMATNRSAAASAPSLLSAADINAIVGTSDLKLMDRDTQLRDCYYQVTPAECNTISTIVLKELYSRAGITAIKGATFFAPGIIQHERVTQTLADLPSAAAADKLFADLIAGWRTCDGKPYEGNSVKSTARIVSSGTATATTVFDREGENILPRTRTCSVNAPSP